MLLRLPKILVDMVQNALRKVVAWVFTWRAETVRHRVYPLPWNVQVQLQASRPVS